MAIEWDAARRPVRSVLHAVGRTPMVRLERIAPEGIDLLAKVEWFGPTGSVKDRIYLHMIESAERRGDLRPGMTILECTTGNAGIACAAVAAVKGYDCVIVMPEGMGEERKGMVLGYGAELVLTPGAGTDIDLALTKMREMVAAQPGHYFVPAEFDNPDNVEAQLISGDEIWEQTDGSLDAVVAAQGTGGWITGVARSLKERDGRVRAYAVEPAECPLITQRRWGAHGIPGIGDGIIPRNLDLAAMDGIITVSTAESVGMARRLAREEGLLCGPSSGCNVTAALKIAAVHPELRRIVTVIADTGQRYLSSELLGEEREAIRSPVRDHGLDDRTIAELERHRDRLEIIQ
jgi:cysteine synthase A